MARGGGFDEVLGPGRRGTSPERAKASQDAARAKQDDKAAAALLERFDASATYITKDTIDWAIAMAEDHGLGFGHPVDDVLRWMGAEIISNVPEERQRIEKLLDEDPPAVRLHFTLHDHDTSKEQAYYLELHPEGWDLYREGREAAIVETQGDHDGLFPEGD